MKDALLDHLGLKEMDAILMESLSPKEAKRPCEMEADVQAKAQKLSYWCKHGVKTSPARIRVQELAGKANVTWDEFDTLLALSVRPAQSGHSDEAAAACVVAGDLASVWDLLTSTANKETRPAAPDSLRKMLLAIKDPAVWPDTRTTLADWLTAAVANTGLTFDVGPLLADQLPAKVLASIVPAQRSRGAIPDACQSQLQVGILRLLRYIFCERGGSSSTLYALKRDILSPASDTGEFLLQCVASVEEHSTLARAHAVALSYELVLALDKTTPMNVFTSWLTVYTNLVQTAQAGEDSAVLKYAVLGLAHLLSSGSECEPFVDNPLEAVLARSQRNVSVVHALTLVKGIRG